MKCLALSVVRCRSGSSCVNSIFQPHRRAQWASRALLAASLAGLLLTGCGKSQPPAPPPPEVGVIKVATQPVTIDEESPAQTEAVDTVEIRPTWLQ